MNRREFLLASAGALSSQMVLGQDARAQTKRVRRDVTTLAANDPFFRNYAKAVRAMHRSLGASDPRRWRNLALIHLNHCPHGAADFVHWHRHFVANFEEICAKLSGDASFALPYWNWSANRGKIPAPFYDLQDLNVTFWNDRSNASSPNWNGGESVNTVGRRALSKARGLQDSSGVFSTRYIQNNILRQTSFSRFSNILESNPHGVAHTLTGGSRGHMSDGMSPLDPIFWLHHCNVDRIWAQWQAAGNQTPKLSMNYSGQFVDAEGHSVTTASSASAIDLSSFGYTYDILSSSQIATRARELGLESFVPGSAKEAQAITTKTETLGTSNTRQAVKVDAPTVFTVSAPQAQAQLFSSRNFWATEVLEAPRIATGGGRILAVISDVSTPTGEGRVIVNVFVNCPYLNAATPTDDPHFAGSFSFFGMRAHPGEFTIDLTDTLHYLSGQAALDPKSIKVQLIPVPAEAEREKPHVEFSVGKVEIISS